MKKKSISLTLLALLLIVSLLAGCGNSNSIPEDAVATVNDEPISMQDYESTLALMKMNYETEMGADLFEEEDNEEGMTLLDTIKEQVLERMIFTEIILQEARAKDLAIDEEELDETMELFWEFMGEDEEMSTFLEDNNIDEAFFRKEMAKELLMIEYQQHYLETMEVSEEEAKAFFEENKDMYTSDQVEASHILVETEQEAIDIRSQLDEGADFATLAQTFSMCPSSADGGNLGMFPRGAMVPPFEEAAFAMEAGDISEPVETDFGWHIILVTQRIKDEEDFEGLKEQIIQQIRQESLQNHIEELRESAEINKREL
ncbi:foldase protein PrsA [Tindallia magadiensis]|uniref:Foldase protein PrsA n=1 Tax=Tindallia magadiensis TaxID=69895 RepID=A0A1I3CYS0_9FIRM|nr:peptidylprolyl isomerase [Tindallia magadiensis]SFH79700.1 foldase protein PrsA [Tindallia magadiensis]